MSNSDFSANSDSNSDIDGSWPIDKIEKSGVSLLVVGIMLPMSALVLGGIMIFFSWAEMAWTLDIVVAVLLFLLFSCLLASFIVPRILTGSKISEFASSINANSEPIEYADRIISANMSSKIVQLSILDGAANACFVGNIVTPSTYLVIGGLLATFMMIVNLPFPGWLDSRFRDGWSELTGRTSM